ncbi:MAG: hypothetical protein AB8U25_04035 [Rickettsiales endosymbiont of Dermacentor nuttalli]
MHLANDGYNCNAGFPSETRINPTSTTIHGALTVSGNLVNPCSLTYNMLSLKTSNTDGHVSFVGRVETCNLGCDLELITMA